MNWSELAMVIGGALVVDRMVGDPFTPWHPVALTGRLALRWEAGCRRGIASPFWAGLICSLAVYAVCAGAAGGLVWLVLAANYHCALATAAVLISFTIAPRSLCDHARAVEMRLLADDLPGARRRVGLMVSRDPEALDRIGVIRSCLESMGENLSDGVTAALFYAALGGLAGGPAGAAAAAWGYRAVNTLDATFGYKNERYRRFGTFPARFDDAVNWLPARLTPLAVALAAALTGGHAFGALRCAWRDHRKHPSPNSAWGMAALAGALGVRLGGRTRYASGWEDYPCWGDPIEAMTAGHIRRARCLVAVSAWIFALGMVTAAIVIGRVGRW